MSKWFVWDNTRAYLILVFTVLMCYGNTIYNDYSLDDSIVVTQNSYVQKGISGIPDIVSNPYLVYKGQKAEYRPINEIILAIEFQCWGMNPHLSHLISLILYIVCVCLLFLVLSKVFSLDKIHPILPFIVSVFYAVHPSHTEVVASIKNREELLSVLFVFPSLFYFHKFFTTGNRIAFAILSILFLFLSYFSKLISLPVIAVMILMGFYFQFHKTRKWDFIIFISAVVILTAGYSSILYSFGQRSINFIENPLASNTDVSVWIGTSFETLLFYFRFMFFPYPFRFFYGYNVIPLIPFTSPVSILSFIIHLSLGILGIIMFFKKKITGFFICAYLICILMYSNFLAIYPGIVSERALFFPGIWFIVFISLLIYYFYNSVTVKLFLPGFKKIIILISFLFFLSYSWLTIQRNFQWKNRITLMGADIKHLSNSTMGNFIYALALYQEGMKSNTDSVRVMYLKKSIIHYRQAIKISPDYPEPYYKIGMIYEYDMQLFDSAFQYFSRGFLMDTPNAPIQFQLAKLHFFKGNLSEADKHFSNLYYKMPKDTFTLFFYSQVLSRMKNFNKAIDVANQLKQLTPGLYYGYLASGVVYETKGDIPTAIENFEAAFERGCRDEYAYNTLMKYYLASGKLDKVNLLQKMYGKSTY